MNPFKQSVRLFPSFKPGLPLAAMLLLSGCQSAPSVKIPEVPGKTATNINNAPVQVVLNEARMQDIGIQVKAAQVINFPSLVQLTGEIQALNNAVSHVYTPVMGRVNRIGVELGQVLRTGQPLMMLKSDDIGKIQVDLLTAILDIDTEIKQSKASIGLSKSTYHREASLAAEGISSQVDVDTSRTQYYKDQQQLASLQIKRQATINTFRERLELYGLSGSVVDSVVKTKEIYPFLTLPSPVSGVVLSRNINQGELADPSKELMTIGNLGNVWAVGDVFEQDVEKIQIAQPVKISVDGLPGKKFQGKISYVGNILDPKTRTLDVRVDVANPNAILKPNMFVMMKVVTGTHPMLAVPKNAVEHIGDADVVFVTTEKSNVFVTQPVKVGITDAGMTEVLTGLKQGQSVVTHGTIALLGEMVKETQK